MAEALYRKYRPSTFADVTGQEHVKTTVQNQVLNGAFAHAYLFTGPRGVGKTTMARLIAKRANCETPKGAEPCNTCDACAEILNGSCLDVIEIDAASHTDVENVRENIVKNVRFAPNRWKHKVFIIDEVHMLSTSAFNALLKTLEEPPEHAIFVLATTEIHKVPQTIISRCQRFDFRRIPVSELVARLNQIAKDEGVELEEAVLQEVARHADGCARDAESLLGQILALGEKKITMETASLVLPATNTVLVLDFLEAITKNETAKAVLLINEFVEQGIDMPQFADDAIELLRAMLFAKLGSTQGLDESLHGESKEKAQSVLEMLEVQKVKQMIEGLLEARRAMKLDKIPQLPLELAVVELTQSAGPANFPKQEVVSSRPAPVAPPAPPPPVPSEKAEAPAESPEELPPVEAKEVILDSVPVVSFEEVQKKWPEVFEQLKSCNASLPIMVKAGELSNVDGDQVELSFEYGLYAESINKDQNRRLIEQVMERVIGKKLRIKGIHQSAEKDEVVSGLLEEFGGNVV